MVRLDLLANHDEAYVDDIEEACAAGGAVLDPDTRVGPNLVGGIAAFGRRRAPRRPQPFAPERGIWRS